MTKAASDMERASPRRPASRRRAGAVRCFLSDRRGFAAVEFGFIAPVLALMLLGAIEVTRAVAIDRRFSLATNMIADLVTREESLTKDDMDAIYAIIGQVMSPFDAEPLKISVIPIVSSVTDASKIRVYANLDPAAGNPPAYHGGTVQKAQCAAYDALPLGLLDKNETLIAVKASYTFTPLFAREILGSATWEQTAYAKPRKTSCVEFVASSGTPNSKVCGGCF